MAAFYREVNPESVAFRQKNTEDKNWYLTTKPAWLWGTADYKVVDLEKDDYLLM